MVAGRGRSRSVRGAATHAVCLAGVMLLGACGARPVAVVGACARFREKRFGRCVGGPLMGVSVTVTRPPARWPFVASALCRREVVRAVAPGSCPASYRLSPCFRKLVMCGASFDGQLEV